jgi:hypothetical protein
VGERRKCGCCFVPGGWQSVFGDLHGKQGRPASGIERPYLLHRQTLLHVMSYRLQQDYHGNGFCHHGISFNSCTSSMNFTRPVQFLYNRTNFRHSLLLNQAQKLEISINVFHRLNRRKRRLSTPLSNYSLSTMIISSMNETRR